MEPPGLARLVASPAAASADQVFLVHFLVGGSLVAPTSGLWIITPIAWREPLLLCFKEGKLGIESVVP